METNESNNTMYDVYIDVKKENEYGKKDMNK